MGKGSKNSRKKQKSDTVSDKLSGDSKDLSALGGGNVKNISSSDPSSGTESLDRKEIKKVPSKLDISNEKRDMKRPSLQFIEKLNLTDVNEVIDDKGLIPINFGNEEKVAKNKSKKMTNKVRTTKYTWFTWAPLSLLMQFKRAANIYFLIISVLTLMPFSPKSPASMIGTFTFVLFVTMLKEALENYFRYKSDKEANGRL